MVAPGALRWLGVGVSFSFLSSTTPIVPTSACYGASTGDSRSAGTGGISSGNQGFVPPLWNGSGPVPDPWNGPGLSGVRKLRLRTGSFRSPETQGPFQTLGTDRHFPESGNSGPVPQGVEQARIRSTGMEHARIRSIGVERSPNFRS